MTLKNHLSRVKGKFKQHLGMSLDNPSSTSLRAPTPLSPGSTDTLAPKPAGLIPSLGSDETAPASATVPLMSPALRAPSVVTGMINIINRHRHRGTVTWAGLKTLLQVVESSADIFPPLKSAVGGLNKCIVIFEAASKGRREYQELQKNLDCLLKDLSGHISRTTSANITMGMRSLCMGLNEELELVQEKATRGTIQGYAEALDDSDEIMECYRRIKGHLERLTLNANLSIWGIVDKLQVEARLQRLSSARSAVYNSAESEDVQRRECTPGTRKEELARLLAWARDKNPEKRDDVYWVNGMAGTGKTTIAYSLCSELEKLGELGASFFCSRLIPECRNIKLVIPAIAYQLARYSYPFQCALSTILGDDPDVHTRTLRTQFDSLIVKPLSNPDVKPTLPEDFVVVIDALDECENEDAVGQILDVLLSGLATSKLPIRFLLSSRPEPEIYRRMMERLGAGRSNRLVLHDLDKAKVRHDIETFLKAELRSINLSPPQLRNLVDRSGVLFIFASTVVRYIQSGLRLGQYEKRLEIVLSLESASARGNHKDIDRLYSSILGAIFDSSCPEEVDKTQMKMILGAVICAQEPMTVNALTGLLGLADSQEVDAMLRLLCSVVNIAENSGLVTTLHASFPDFILNYQRSSSFHCDPSTAHARMLQGCFKVIQSNDQQFNICALPSSYLRDADVLDLERRIGQGISEQLYYSCRYWISHVTLGEMYDEESGMSLHKLLSKWLLLWMEVLNLKKNMHIGPGIMRQAEEWARLNAYPEETVELAHDAWRFVTMFTGHAVSQSTPHIYISMLPFWPDSAPVSKHYKGNIRQAIQPRGAAMTRRQLSLLATWSFSEGVRCVSYAQHGSLIAYSLSTSVYVMDGTTGRAVLGPLDHGHDIRGIAFSVDGTLLASCSKDRTVKVWSTIDRCLVWRLTGHTDSVTSVCFTPDGRRVVSGSRDKHIRVWSIESGETVVGPLIGHRDRVWTVCVSPNGAYIASGSADRSIRIWSADSGMLLFDPFERHTSAVWSLCFSPDSTRLVSGSNDTTVCIWSNLTAKVHVEVLEGHTGSVESVAFSSDGKQIVSGSADETVRIWDVEGKPRPVRVLDGHNNVVFCVQWLSDGASVVSCSCDRTIRVWDVRSQGSADASLEGHTQAVTSVAFSRDGSRILSGSNDQTIYTWDAHSGQRAVGPMIGHTNWVNSVCFSPNSPLVASGSDDQTIRLWDAYTGRVVGNLLTDHSGGIFSVHFSPDGALLASGSEDQTIRLWDVRTRRAIGSPLEQHKSWVRSVCFSPNGSRLVSGSSDGTILVWDLKTKQPALPPLEGHTNQVLAVCVSPNGTCIASGSYDTTVRLWDTRNGKSISGPLQGHTASVNSVCFSSDSVYVASCSDDKTIRLWNAQLGEAVGSPLVGHTEPVLSVAFSPHGKLIVSGSSDACIRVWNVDDEIRVKRETVDNDKAAELPLVHQSWVLHDGGWVVDPQSRLLAWVPPDLYVSLTSPHNPLLLSTKGDVRVHFESKNIGDSWTECYKP